MSRELTITVSDEVYHGLQSVAGDRTISELIEELARPVLAESNLEAAYREALAQFKLADAKRAIDLLRDEFDV